MVPASACTAPAPLMPELLIVIGSKMDTPLSCKAAFTTLGTTVFEVAPKAPSALLLEMRKAPAFTVATPAQVLLSAFRIRVPLSALKKPLEEGPKGAFNCRALPTGTSMTLAVAVVLLKLIVRLVKMGLAMLPP